MYPSPAVQGEALGAPLDTRWTHVIHISMDITKGIRHLHFKLCKTVSKTDLFTYRNDKTIGYKSPQNTSIQRSPYSLQRHLWVWGNGSRGYCVQHNFSRGLQTENVMLHYALNKDANLMQWNAVGHLHVMKWSLCKSAWWSPVNKTHDIGLEEKSSYAISEK